MCGIVGIVDKIGRIVSEEFIRRMCGTITHRGPDDEGIHIRKGGNVGIGMRRLKIIDLNTGHQPIHNEDRTLWIVFNGEIYNFLELRKDLEKKGHVFYTKTDTEVIVHLYEELGADCVHRLRGMFAFAILNEKDGSVFIARDRLGIKPLFYLDDKERFMFASEMKGILAFDFVKRDFDWRALSAYFTLSYIPAPMTVFIGIRKLNPGHYLIYRDGEIRIAKYWDLHFRPNHEMREVDFQSRFLEVFDEAVKLRLISDVPLGGFLSGGVDSSSVVAFMSRHHNRVKTLSIGFGGEVGCYDDERKYARLVGERYGTEALEYEVAPDFKDGRLIEEIVRAFDEPFADHGAIPTYFVCKLARESMTVALSGLGGDEMFSGYPRYLGFHLGQSYSRLPSALRKLIPWFIEKVPERGEGTGSVNQIKRFFRGGSLPGPERYLGYISLLSRYAKDELFSPGVTALFDEDPYEREYLSLLNSSNSDSPLDRVYSTDCKVYLPDDILALTDRVSMMHSLEVRVPFCDHILVELCATIPYKLKMKGMKQKYLLKKAMAPFLPREVLEHRKQGFVGPMGMWIKNELKEYICDTVIGSSPKDGLFNQRTIARILDEHFGGKQLNTALIWAVFIFKVWHRVYMEGEGTVKQVKD
jgi:asparagine synthase (glutamine-hydrolysing)